MFVVFILCFLHAAAGLRGGAPAVLLFIVLASCVYVCFTVHLCYVVQRYLFAGRSGFRRLRRRDNMVGVNMVLA